jgi:hypothetical protein
MSDGLSLCMDVGLKSQCDINTTLNLVSTNPHIMLQANVVVFSMIPAFSITESFLPYCNLLRVYFRGRC